MCALQEINFMSVGQSLWNYCFTELNHYVCTVVIIDH